jgi:MFS family permease
MTLGTRPRQRLTLAVACMAQGMMVLDVLIVSVALPAMQRELHLSPAGLEWVVSGYALALAALIPTGGALGDHFGRKRIFVNGVTLFTLASVGCALSVSGGMLVGFQVIQGIGGAVMSSLTLSLISEAVVTGTWLAGAERCPGDVAVLNAPAPVPPPTGWLRGREQAGRAGRGGRGGRSRVAW